ncbi:alpha/beta fold hydrolase [Sphingoaurantiacus capsulatus]|uniref:Alpha/beta fold hydrolase n=1 Tax=Sphingoaurantiacus capsulatus TaxID=1771310 RepID=A0ABV7X6H1_9SPHN
MASAPPDPQLVDQMRGLVDRAIQRNIKGLEYFASPSPAVGATPKDLLLSRGTLNLSHYRPLADEIYRVPILLVMATTNRGYILDMVPGQSFVEFLLRQGFDVYMVDWNPPRADEKHLRLEDYVLDFLPECIARVQADSGESDITLMGYCFGGVLSLLYSALHTDGPVKNLVTFTTPIDFTQMPLFQAWSDERHFDVDRLVDTLGNIPPDLIFTAFDMLRPAARLAGNIRLWDHMWNDEFVKSYRMFDRWATDALPLAGEYFRQTTKDLMWKNGLYNRDLQVGGRTVDIGKIKVPMLHVVAEHDHIVPYEASKPLVQMIGSTDKEEVVLKGGHISLVAGANAVRRLWPRLDLWLQERST